MIDRQQLTELRNDIGDEDFEDVVSLTLQEIGEVLARLRVMQDPVEISEACHGLKGLSLNIGFTALSRAAGEAEHHPLRADVDVLQTTFEASRRALHGISPTRPH